jgi:AraC family transcriptional regulator, regulatory protein of adaptative response / methylated-DNA-[protein]-cysteine methyltransferase
MVSYGEVAERIGPPKEAYPVGGACAANRITIAIPCHPVVRKNGAIGDYRWGFARKRAPLEQGARDGRMALHSFTLV